MNLTITVHQPTAVLNFSVISRVSIMSVMNDVYVDMRLQIVCNCFVAVPAKRPPEKDKSATPTQSLASDSRYFASSTRNNYIYTVNSLSINNDTENARYFQNRAGIHPRQCEESYDGFRAWIESSAARSHPEEKSEKRKRGS